MTYTCPECSTDVEITSTYLEGIEPNSCEDCGYEFDHGDLESIVADQIPQAFGGCHE